MEIVSPPNEMFDQVKTAEYSNYHKVEHMVKENGHIADLSSSHPPEKKQYKFKE